MFAACLLGLQPAESGEKARESDSSLAILITVFIMLAGFFGVTHYRILVIGEGAYYEPYPTATIQSGFFSGLQAGPRLQRVQQELAKVLEVFPSQSVLFGPRMEFEYAVVNRRPIRGMPPTWDAGYSLSPSRLPQMISILDQQPPDLMVFLKHDYTRMGIVAGYVQTSPNYERVDSFPDLTVYVHKHQVGADLVQFPTVP